MSAGAIFDPWASYLDRPSPMASSIARSVFEANDERLAEFEIGVLRFPRAVETELDRLIEERNNIQDRR